MENLLLSLAEIHLTMAAVILLLLLLSRLFGGKYSARCRYLVWTVVIVRLCIPIGTQFIPAAVEVEIPMQETEIAEAQPAYTPETNTVSQDIEPPIYTVPEDASPISAEFDGYIPAAPHEQFASESETEIIETSEPVVPAETTDIPTQTPAPKLPNAVDLLSFIGIIWLAGAAVMLVWRLGGYAVVSARMKKKLRPAPAEYNTVYRSAAEKMGIRSLPPLYISSGTHSPMLCGYFKPIIILPDMEFSETALDGILSHELTHHKRHDLWVKLLCTLAVSLGWFDPLVYIAAARCNREMELSCDEAVLRGLDDSARISYGNTMLDIIRACHSEQSSLTTHFNPRKSAVRERFQGILDSSRKKRGVGVIAVVVVLCVLAGAVIACTIDDGADESGDNNAIMNLDNAEYYQVSYIDYTPDESGIETVPIENTQIRTILRQTAVDGVDVILYTTNDGGLYAAYRQSGDVNFTRFYTICTAETEMPDYSLERVENVLGINGFAIEYNLSENEKKYFIIEDGAPELYLSASRNITEDDCDGDGVIEVIQQSSIFLTVYDNADGTVATRVIPLNEKTGERVRYDETQHLFEFDYERNEGEGPLYIRRGVLDGDLMKITDVADEWVLDFEFEDAKLYYNAAAMNCEGVAKIWRFDYGNEQFVFKTNAVDVGISNKFDYTRDGVKDWRLCCTDARGNEVYFQYDPETHEFHEIELEETIDGTPTDQIVLPDAQGEWLWILSKEGFSVYVDSGSIDENGIADQFLLRNGERTAKIPFSSCEVGPINPMLNVFDYSGDGIPDCKIEFDATDALLHQFIFDGVTFESREVSMEEMEATTFYEEISATLAEPYREHYMMDSLDASEDSPLIDYFTASDHFLNYYHSSLYISLDDCVISYIRRFGPFELDEADISSLIEDSVEKYLERSTIWLSDIDLLAEECEIPNLLEYKWTLSYPNTSSTSPVDLLYQNMRLKREITPTVHRTENGFCSDVILTESAIYRKDSSECILAKIYTVFMNRFLTLVDPDDLTETEYTDESGSRCVQIIYQPNDEVSVILYDSAEPWVVKTADGSVLYPTAEITPEKLIQAEFEGITVTSLDELEKYNDNKKYLYSHTYNFFYNLLSGKSEYPEFNTLVIEDYKIRFTEIKNDDKVYFDFTVKESGLDTLPIGEYHMIVRQKFDLIFSENGENNHVINPYSDVKEVNMLRTFLFGMGFWNTPAFGEGTKYPGMHSFICEYYGDKNFEISLEEYKRIAAEKFGCTEVNEEDLYMPYEGIVQAGDRGGFDYCFTVENVSSADGMTTITVQFFADSTRLLKSHRIEYYIGEDETWHGYKIIEKGKYEPYGMQYYEDEPAEKKDYPVYTVSLSNGTYMQSDQALKYLISEYVPETFTELDGVSIPVSLNTDASRSELLMFHKISDISADVFAVSGDIVAGGDSQSAYVFMIDADGGWKRSVLPMNSEYYNRGVCKGVILEPYSENGETRWSLLMPLTDGTVTMYRYNGEKWINLGRVNGTSSSAFAKSVFADGNMICTAFENYSDTPQVFISFDGGQTTYPYDIPLSWYYTYSRADIVDLTVNDSTFTLLYRLFRDDGSEFAVLYTAEIGGFTGTLQETEPIGALSWYLYSSAADSGMFMTEDGKISAAVVYNYANGNLNKVSEISGGVGDYSEFDISAAVKVSSNNMPLMSLEKVDPSDTYEGVRDDGYFYLTYEYHGENYGPLTVTASEVFDTDAGQAIYERVEYSTGDFYYEYHVRVSQDFLVRLLFSNMDCTEEECREIVKSLVFVNSTETK